MSDLVQDVRYAARQMARRPGLTIFAVLSLALGIGVNSSISPWSTPCCCATCRRYGRRNWWTSTSARAGEFRYGRASFPDFADLRASYGVVSDLAAFNPTIASWDTATGPSCCSARR